MGQLIETLKDANYRVLGYIEKEGDGTLVLKDSNWIVKGYYDPRTNQTKDPNYRVVANGNLLTTLLFSL